MTQLEKLFRALLQGAKDARYQELEKILLRLGYSKREGKGSHTVFTHPQHRALVIPAKNPVKRVYIEQVRSILAEYFKEGEK